MNAVIGGSAESIDLAVRRYVDLYGRSHVEKLPVMESRVLDELKEYSQKLESIKLENRKSYISSSKNDNQKQETTEIKEIDSNQKTETNKTERRKSIAERMKEGEDDPNDFWYNPTHEDLSLKPHDVKIMEGMLAFRDRLAKLSDSTPLDFSDMICVGGKPEVGKSDSEEGNKEEVARNVDSNESDEEKEDDFPAWGNDGDESGENETDDESDFDDGWEEMDLDDSEESEESEEPDESGADYDEKESEENDVEDEDDSDTWGSSEDDSEDDMDDGWGSDDLDDSDSTDENTEKEERGESDSYDWGDGWGDTGSEDSGDDDFGNEKGEETGGVDGTTEGGKGIEVDTNEDDQGSWDLDAWSDDDDTEVMIEKSEDDVKRDLKKVFGISLKSDKKEEKELRKEEECDRREEIKEEKEVKPSREVAKEEKKPKPRKEDIGDVDDGFWNDESSQDYEKEDPSQERVVKKKENPVSYDTSSLRGFVKSHKGCKCTIEEALQYFKKADIEKDLRMGRVFKGKKSLFI